MGWERAFSWVSDRGGSTVRLENPLRVANRLRTRDREIRVLELCPEGSASSGPVSLVDRCGTTLAASSGGADFPTKPVVLPPETSFYLVADLPAGGHYLQEPALAEVHPLLVDLGTWIGGAGWRPSGGPRIYPANLRFEVSSTRRRSQRAAQILGLAAQGLTDKAIAERLGVGASTVETHWRLLRERGGFASRTEAVADHFFKLSERTREDLEAQRDRLATEAWRRENSAVAPRMRGEMRSWPRL